VSTGAAQSAAPVLTIRPGGAVVKVAGQPDRGLGDGVSLGVQGRSPGRGSEDEVPQKLKHSW